MSKKDSWQLWYQSIDEDKSGQALFQSFTVTYIFIHLYYFYILSIDIFGGQWFWYDVWKTYHKQYLCFTWEFWTSRQSILENHDLKVLDNKLNLNQSSWRIQEQGQSTNIAWWREKIYAFLKKNFCIHLWGNTKHSTFSV